MAQYLGLVVQPGEDAAAAKKQSRSRIVRWYPWLITLYCITLALDLSGLLTERHLSTFAIVLRIGTGGIVLGAIAVCSTALVITRRRMR